MACGCGCCFILPALQVPRALMKDCAAVIARLAATLTAMPATVQAFVSITCAGKDVTEVEQLAALKALQV